MMPVVVFIGCLGSLIVETGMADMQDPALLL